MFDNPASKKAARTSLALLLLALATHAPALPLAAWPALALALASRLLLRRRWVQPLQLIGLAGVILLAGTAWGWLDANTIRVALLCVLALKWAESKSEREFALLAGCALIAGTLGLLQWGEWTGLILILLLPLLALTAMEAAYAPATAGTNPSRQIFAALRKHFVRILLALPLAAALFVFFPRIPGPLWDIGTSFGLPLSLWFEPASQQGLGVATSLKPGQSQASANVISETRPVLIAEFDGWVPPTALLYWRGPVYYDFNGHEWRLDPSYDTGQGRMLMRQGWSKGTQFSETLSKKTQEISYSVRLSPHSRLWLYGLDLPSRLPAESFVSEDWQVLAHQPVDAETSYTLKSWLEWEAGGILTEPQQQRALALPESGNPRLRELGAQLATLPLDERAGAALSQLATGNYQVLDQFEVTEGPDSFDHFWFDSRTGNAELTAGAFVILMRAAGVPARLVTGYRGGKLMALTDYVIVKQSHAHAWVEIHDSPRGWRRIDPIDLISPERFQGRARKKTAPAKRPEPAPSQEQERPASPANTPSPQLQPALLPAQPIASAAKIPDANLDAFLSRWLFRLDGEIQHELLASLGEKLGETFGKKLSGGLAWVWLLIGAAVACVLVMLARHLIELQRDARLPAPQRTWNRLLRLLAKYGFPRKPWETPTSFAHRVGAIHPRWDKSLRALASAWSDWLYAPQDPEAPRRITSAARILHNQILAEAPPGRPRSTSTLSSPSL